jgi:preprotein translocase subunit Sec63
MNLIGQIHFGGTLGRIFRSRGIGIGYKSQRLFSDTSTAYYNPYAILGAEKAEDLKAIKKKYLKLVAAHHPDVNPSEDSERIFRLVQESFERIKELRGLSTRRSLNTSLHTEKDDFQSVRPSPDQYR